MLPLPTPLPASAALVLGLVGMPVGACAAESAYTDFNADACTELSRQEEGESVELKCPGFAGVPVFYSEGDLRTDVDFGASDGEFSTFGAFNSIGSTIEWRHAGGKPFAAIVRYHVTTGADGGKKSDVLLVAKVGRDGAPGCPVAVVDGTTVEQANGVARGAAAFARQFNCKTDKPVAIGAPNSPAASFTQATPEGR